MMAGLIIISVGIMVVSLITLCQCVGSNKTVCYLGFIAFLSAMGLGIGLGMILGAALKAAGVA